MELIMKFYNRIFFLLLCSLLIIPDIGMSQDKMNETFDLVIYGSNLNTDEIEILVKTNPQYGGQWDTISRNNSKINFFTDNSQKLLKLSGLSMEKYFGQDIRENYIGIKVRSLEQEPLTKISAFYAFPAGAFEKESLVELIENHDPVLLDKCLAKIIRARPLKLDIVSYYTEHIEAPVRHKKPGIQEVKWLNILF
ncbi:MAG: hypothetical protein ACOCPM_04430 [Bacteroidales bacterium]